MNAVLKLGNAILGEWRGGATRPAMPAPERQVRQRRNSLSRLAHLRITQSLATGEGTAWAIVIADTLAGLGAEVTGEAIVKMARSFGLPPQMLRAANAVARDAETARRLWGAARHPLLDSQTVADLLEVTAAEREEAQIKDIGAIDESQYDRNKRLDRERKRAQRAAKAGPRLTQAQLAQAEGISLSTWKRRHTDLKTVRLSSKKKGAGARVTRSRVKIRTLNGSEGGAHA